MDGFLSFTFQLGKFLVGFAFKIPVYSLWGDVEYVLVKYRLLLALKLMSSSSAYQFLGPFLFIFCDNLLRQPFYILLYSIHFYVFCGCMLFQRS